MKWFNFDGKGRLTNIQQKMDGDANTVTIAAYTYDDMGAVTEKKIHNARETTSYTYDFTGRQTGVTSPSFSYSLWFDKMPSGMTGARRHDGNLAHVTWNGSTSDDKGGYSFSYDAFGQMTQAKYLQASGQSSWTRTDRFAERGIGDLDDPIVYDKNGNIRSLYRTNDSGGQLHKLEYSYNGNQLSSIMVNGNQSAAFTYDANGNMTRDGHTGVGIEYNVLDLPQKVFANGAEVRYIYDATGAKLATVAANGSLTYYRSVFTYAAAPSGANEELIHVLHPEGLVSKGTGGWSYMYFKTDHVGSTRVVLEANGAGLTERQRTDFYPFGLAHGMQINNLQHNKYLYGGKEYQDQMLGSAVLGLYDFHARYYNPIYGRWFNIDPALQTTNPYIYCGNSPMMYVDKDGEFAWIPFLAMTFMSGMQANFMYCAENGTNPFNPGNWNWKSANTYISLIRGAAGAASMLGQPIPNIQLSGAIPNAILQAGIDVTLNGIGNLTEKRKFFDGWLPTATVSAISGAVVGYKEAKESGRNRWTGRLYRNKAKLIVWLDPVTAYGHYTPDGNFRSTNNWLNDARMQWRRYSNLDHYYTMKNPIVQSIHATHRSFMIGAGRVGFTAAEWLGEGLFWTGAALGSTGVGAVPGGGLVGLGKSISWVGGLGNSGLDMLEGNYAKGLLNIGFSTAFGKIGDLGKLVDGADVIMNVVVSPFEYAVGYGINMAY